MINEDILKFSEFLDYYKQDYAKPSWEISLPNPDDEDFNENEEQIPIVTSDYIMLDFDSMCKDADFYPKENLEECNRPSTVDGLYYRILDENKLELFLVEFKTFYFTWDNKLYYNNALKKIKELRNCNPSFKFQKGIGMLEKIEQKLGNSIENSLKLKPYESLFVVLPKIYDEYCEEKNIPESDKINLYNLFKSNLFTIKLFIVGKQYPNDTTRAYNGKLGNTLEKQYKRLDFVNVLKQHPQRLCFEREFDSYANKLRLDEHENLKSLNYTGI